MLSQPAIRFEFSVNRTTKKQAYFRKRSHSATLVLPTLGTRSFTHFAFRLTSVDLRISTLDVVLGARAPVAVPPLSLALVKSHRRSRIAN